MLPLGGEPNYQALTLPGNDHAWALWPVVISGTESVKDRALAFLATIFDSPSITTQPANKTVAVGQEGQI